MTGPPRRYLRTAAPFFYLPADNSAAAHIRSSDLPEQHRNQCPRRIPVTQTDHQDIGICSKRIAKRLFKRRGIAAHLALTNECSTRSEEIFDWTFHRYDMAALS